MRRFDAVAIALSLACALALPVAAQEKMEKKEERKPAAVEVKGSILFQIKAAEDKLMQLAEATPAEKFSWRPAEGVRSIGEVYAHVAGANYFIPTFWGAKIPEGVDPRSFEKSGNDKAATIATLKKSFDYLREQANALSADDLNRAIKVFGNDAHVIDALMILASHGHEHLGQAIAYARSNNITPPWSRRGE